METLEPRAPRTLENQTAIENEARQRIVGMGAEDRSIKLATMTPRAIAKATAGIERSLRHYPFGGSDPQYYALGQADSQIGKERMGRIQEARSALMELREVSIENAPSVIKETPDHILETMHDQNERAERHQGFTNDAPWQLPSEIGASLETEVSNRSKAADRRDRGEILPEDWKRWETMTESQMMADMEDLELPGLEAAKNDAEHATPSSLRCLNKETENREIMGNYLASEAMRRPERAAKWIPNLSNDHRELLRRGNETLATERDRSGAGVAVRGAGRPAGDATPQAQKQQQTISPTTASEAPTKAKQWHPGG